MINTSSEKKLRVVSWNVNGIRACYKKGLMDSLEVLQPDILCLQETKGHRDQVENEAKTLGYQFDFWSSAERKGYSGVATFSDLKPIEVSRGWGLEEYDKEGRIVWSRYSKFDLYNIYFPNGGSGEPRHLFKQEFLKKLNLHLKEQLQSGRSIIVVGDYNVAHTEIDVHDPVRLSKESGFLPEERQWFDEFLELGFVDCFRHLHSGEKDRYSWWSYRELARFSNRGWRIDYVCCSRDLVPHLQASEIYEQIEGSDHCPVMAEFSGGLCL